MNSNETWSVVMIRAFPLGIKILSDDRIDPEQSSPRSSIPDVIIAEVDGDRLIAFTCVESINAPLIKPDNVAGERETLVSVRARLAPDVFFSRYPRQEALAQIENGLLKGFPGATAARAGLGVMAILTRRRQGLMELATLDKPGEYFAFLRDAIELDPNLSEVARTCASEIAKVLYRSKAEAGLIEQMDDRSIPVYKEPYQSIFLAGVYNYLSTNGQHSLNIDSYLKRYQSSDHYKNCVDMLSDFFANSYGRNLEAVYLPKALVKHLVDRGAKITTTALYSANALHKREDSALYIKAGYDWRAIFGLTKFKGDDAETRAASWVQHELELFSRKDSSESDFWSGVETERCVTARDILKAIREVDPEGFEQIVSKLPQWTKLACLALGVLAIQEVESVPAAGRDRALSSDLGL